jgi:hypothetical protein
MPVIRPTFKMKLIIFAQFQSLANNKLTYQLHEVDFLEFALEMEQLYQQFWAQT